jgi:hypothetical protein
VTAVHRRRLAVQGMLHVETADVQLDRQAAVTHGLPVSLSQEFVERSSHAVH